MDVNFALNSKLDYIKLQLTALSYFILSATDSELPFDKRFKFGSLKLFGVRRNSSGNLKGNILWEAIFAQKSCFCSSIPCLVGDAIVFPNEFSINLSSEFVKML